MFNLFTARAACTTHTPDWSIGQGETVAEMTVTKMIVTEITVTEKTMTEMKMTEFTEFQVPAEAQNDGWRENPQVD